MTTFDYGLEAFLSATDVGGRLGLVTNATALDRRGVHLVDRLADHPRLKLTAIFTPEHGFGADAPDGEAVASSTHQRYRVPIHSLYGPRKTPSAEELNGIDLLAYDIQDVGVRFYTYISTLRNTMEAAAEREIPFHVLDRPDLLGGIDVEGPMLQAGFESFVGHLPIPLRYGLTPGELARWWNSRLERAAALTVWQCQGYRRGTAFEQLGVPWVKLSPSMRSTATARFYPGTCLYEGTNLSEGRGSEAPFQILGAPWADPDAWIEALAPLLPADVRVSPVTFRPTFSKFEGEACRGIRLDTGSPLLHDAFGIGIMTLSAFMRSHPGRIEFTTRPSLPHPFFDHLAGNSWVREALLAGAPPSEIVARANAEHQAFAAERQSFWLYSGS
ncbi:MAG TPA: DUF1343 domain-containing protein [Candidatus Ozemobacteraceae bacterium]|nr:DUF1343 domain-containing protein [Candidatus Ozemobacteraceae bacterium]